jgi:steroid delta-isomerase-like uncharacterized protein
MTRNDIEAMFARRREAWLRHDAAALALDHSEHCVVESPLAGGSATGRDAIGKLYQIYFGAFTDMRFEEDALVIDGERVALLARISGTDNGGFMGMSPTHRAISVWVVFFYTIENGEIVRERRVYDFTGVLVQVGLLKAKPT